MSAAVSDRVGPYEIVTRIASGGMADVFLAIHHGPHGLERTVALKRLRRDGDERDDERLEAFLDEARIMASLTHPNIVQVYDVLSDGDDWYIAVEHVDGPDLRHLLDAARGARRRLPRAEALGIVLGVCEALAYAHSRQDDIGEKLDLVHRDLTPANVVVSYDGAVKLVDFGIARASTNVHETRTGVIKGTPGYMAPEQVRGDPMDRRADVFGVGVLAYEVCVGERPFPPELDATTKPPLRSASELDPSFPPALATVLDACLAPDPAARPTGVGVVRDAIVRELLAEGEWPTMARIALLVREIVPGGQHHATVIAPPSVALPRRSSATRRPRRHLKVGLTISILVVLTVVAFVMGRVIAGSS